MDVGHDLLDVVGRDRQHLAQGVERDVHELARGVGLDRDASRLPAGAEPLDHALRIGVARRERGVDAVRSLEHRGGPAGAGGGEAGGQDPVERSGSRVQLLGRGAGGRGTPAARRRTTRRCRARPSWWRRRAPQQLGGDRGGGERARHLGGVQAARVEPVRARGRDPAHDLVADDGRGEQRRRRWPRPARRPRTTTGSTTAVACTRPPAWVSSKSRPCTSAPAASAAAGALTRVAVVEHRRLGRARRDRARP